MSRPQKESLKQRVQNLFKAKGNAAQASRETPGKVEEFFISESLKKELSCSTGVHQRVKAIKELCSLVTIKKLEDHALETIWANIADLLDPTTPSEHRQLVLHFLKCLIIGQYEYLGIMRAVFFQVVRGHDVFDDLPQKLDVFKALSDNGKDLVDFEEETGPFLEKWMPDVISYGKTSDFLRVLVNVIKYNACFLDEDIIAGFVRHTCSVCHHTNSEEDIDQALKVLDAVVCYSCLPTESLSYFIVALCKTVNIKAFCEPSWKLMRNLLGTHLGHSAIYTMCSILEDSHNIADFILLRGAVFFVGMALWGSKRVASLRHRFMSVLPSFHKALYSNSVMVAYEVALSVHRLVKKYGKDIAPGTWDTILDIIEELFHQMNNPKSEQESQTLEALNKECQTLLSYVESLHSSNEYDGSAKMLFDIVEKSASLRPESSLLTLVTYRAQSIHPTKPDWIQNLMHLMDNFFKKDRPATVREKTVEVLSSVFSATSHLYEDELIEKVVLPQFSHIADDPSCHIRKVAVKFLLDVAQACQMERCLDVLDIIAKVIMKPMYHRRGSETSLSKTTTYNEPEFVDIETGILGLLDMFTTKLDRLPSSQAVTAFELLVKHMLHQYRNNYDAEIARKIRARVFGCLLRLRADSLGRLGLPDKDGNLKYSPYILCDAGMEMDFAGRPSPPMATSPPLLDRYCRTTVLPFGQAFKAVTVSLKLELDWNVLQLVIDGLTKALQNKTLVLASRANVDLLCKTMFSMIENANKLNSLYNVPSNFHRMDFFVCVYGLLTAVVPYHAQLESAQKVSLIKCLKHGLKLQCPQQCIDGMMLCVLEMQDTMVKMLPSIILELSKMSATPSMAVPVLEFLSSLIWFPDLYASFVENAYMSIFAVALHYTNPYKFSLYVVSLAHHVIAMWFIKCRLPFRREFVNCITRGLKASCMRPPIFSPTTESSKPIGKGLRRSNSLTKISQKTGKGESQQAKESTSPSYDSLDELHAQLTETCLDMMARFTFSTCTTMPKRSPISEFLLAGGQSQSWLLGNKIITITTSGGSFKMQENGVCEKCNNLIRLHVPEVPRKQTQQGDGAEMQSNFSKKPPMRQRSKSGDIYKGGSDSRAEDEDIAHGDGRRVEPRSRPTSGPAAFTLTKEQTEHPEQHHPAERDPREVSLLQETPSSDREQSQRLLSGSLYQCNCWCRAWAEVHIRRATGNTSWIMRLQNDGSLVPLQRGLPLSDISNLLMYNREIEEHILAFLPSPDSSEGGLEDNEEMNYCQEEETEEGEIDKSQEETVTGAVPVPTTRVIPPLTPQFLLSPQEDLDPTVVNGAVGLHPFALQKDLDKDHLSVSFPRPELGSSPEGGESMFPDNLGPVHKFGEFAKALRHIEKDAQNLIDFDPGQSKPLLQKSPSCPSLELAGEIQREEDHRKKLSSISATSPRALAKDFLEEFSQRPSSFKDVSYLQKRYSKELAEKEGCAGEGEAVDKVEGKEGEGFTDKAKGKMEDVEGIGRQSGKELEGRCMKDRSEGGIESLKCIGQEDMTVAGGLDVGHKKTGDEEEKMSKVGAEEKLKAEKNENEKERLNIVVGGVEIPPESVKQSHEGTSGKERRREDSRRKDYDGGVRGGVTEGTSDLNLGGASGAQGRNTKVQEGARKDTKGDQRTEDEGRIAVAAIQAGRKKSVDFVLVEDDGKTRDIPEEMVLQKPSVLPLEKNKTAASNETSKPAEPYKSRLRGHSFSAIGKGSRQIEREADLGLKLRKVSESSRSSSREQTKSGIDPSFVFLQLYYSPFIGESLERPLAVPLSQVAQRAVKVLDRIPPYDTHKIGVLYVGQDQVEDEIAILSNVYGSSRYMKFLQGLGKLIPLQEAARIEVYTGGLDTSGSDGKFVYWWKDDIMQVIFHVATLMPNKESDPNCTAKKLHIGNDFVSIVYNESRQKYRLGTIKGQFNFAEIVIEPLDKESNLVSIQAKPELEEWIGARGPWLVSDKRVALLVRQMALHANLASQIHKSKVKGTASSSFSSNWLERLRQVARIRAKLAQSPTSTTAQVIGMPVKPSAGIAETVAKGKQAGSSLADFSTYT